MSIVFKERIYKIWKQFTTIYNFAFLPGNCVQRTNIQNLKAIHNFGRRKERKRKLCSKNEYTKSESNSQLFGCCHKFLSNCVQRTNIQNLKAIHNWLLPLLLRGLIVFKERIYKIWKQFTTGSITMSIFRPFQLLGFFNSINKRKISIDKSCNY